MLRDLTLQLNFSAVLVSSVGELRQLIIALNDKVDAQSSELYALAAKSHALLYIVVLGLGGMGLLVARR